MTYPEQIHRRALPLRIIISFFRIVFVFAILIGVYLFIMEYIERFIELEQVETLLILAYGPLVMTGIYWATKGKHSAVAHKLFGLLLYYVFFSVSYILQLLVVMLFQMEMELLIVVFFLVAFLFLPFFEDKAISFISGSVALNKWTARTSYIVSVPLCVGVGWVGIELTLALRDAYSNTLEPSIVAYCTLLFVGLLSSWAYRVYKTKKHTVFA